MYLKYQLIGFRACGLYPLDANAVDYSKICNKEPIIIDTNTTEHKQFSNYLEKEIEPDKLKEFKRQQSTIWTGNMEDTSLFKVWYKVSLLGNNIAAQSGPQENPEKSTAMSYIESNTS